MATFKMLIGSDRAKHLPSKSLGCVYIYIESDIGTPVTEPVRHGSNPDMKYEKKIYKRLYHKWQQRRFYTVGLISDPSDYQNRHSSDINHDETDIKVDTKTASELFSPKKKMIVYIYSSSCHYCLHKNYNNILGMPIFKKEKEEPDHSDDGNNNGETAIDNLENTENPFASLPPEEAEILEKQVKTEEPDIGYFTLYRFATKTDIALWTIGYICSIIYGAALPLFTLVFGNTSQNFSDFYTDPDMAKHEFQNMVNDNGLYFLYIGIGVIVFTCVATFIHVNRGEVITSRIREQYLAAILRQNTAYFDKLGAGEVTSRISNDTNAIQEGISEKPGIIVSGISTFVCALIISFVKDWKLALIMLAVVVAMVASLSGPSMFMIKYSTQELEEYGPASSIAEEAFSAIRTTVAFGAQNRLSDKYDNQLKVVLSKAIKKGIATAIMVGTLTGVVFFAYALALWQGSRFIKSGDSNLGDILTVLMAEMLGAFMLAGASPSFESVGKAVASSKKIFEAIDRKSYVDPSSDNGEKLDTIKGDIKFQNIKFIYPSRPEVTVLGDMTLEIESGQTVALVGMSGSGKSTVIGLLERFYDPVSGEVTIDGHDIKDLNVRWLRQQMALVSQEPVLFAVSIYENVAYGLIGTYYENASEEKKRELVTEACKEANAWGFIQSMTDGLDTNVGERGFLMSGGQKQRIAIARAIISNPKILLLDEATSALDTKSEGLVQEALDRASKNRTTIVIAHRLSTIRHADKIVVMSKGEIIETGAHNELLTSNGPYAKLVDAQKIHSSSVPEEEEEGVEKSENEVFSVKKTLTNSTFETTPGDDPTPVTHQEADEGAPSYSVFYLIRMVSRLEEFQIFFFFF